MSTKKEHWYRIFVACTSTERFDVVATSKEEALERYYNGDATLEADEVDKREVISVEEGNEVR